MLCDGKVVTNVDAQHLEAAAAYDSRQLNGSAARRPLRLMSVKITSHDLLQLRLKLFRLVQLQMLASCNVRVVSIIAK